MSIDFPRAWQIARAARLAEHEFECSYLQSSGGLLCDCKVLTQHPEYLDGVLHGAVSQTTFARLAPVCFSKGIEHE